MQYIIIKYNKILGLSEIKYISESYDFAHLLVYNYIKPSLTNGQKINIIEENNKIIYQTNSNIYYEINKVNFDTIDIDNLMEIDQNDIITNKYNYFDKYKIYF